MDIRRRARAPSHLTHPKDQLCNPLLLGPSLNKSLRCFRSCKPNPRHLPGLLKFRNRVSRPLSVSWTKSRAADASHRTPRLLSYNRPLYLFVYVRLCVRQYGLYSIFLLVLQVYGLFILAFLTISNAVSNLFGDFLHVVYLQTSSAFNRNIFVDRICKTVYYIIRVNER